MTRPGIDLYGLLPELYRERDAATGGVLRAFLDAVSDQAALTGEAAAAFEDDLFIETCRDDIVPLLGELIGAPPLEDIGGGRRTMVARAIVDRQAGGTLHQIAAAAAAASGWHCRAEVLRDRLIWNQNIAFARLATGDRRGTVALPLRGGERAALPRRVDLRRLPDHVAHPMPGRVGVRVRDVTLRRVDVPSATLLGATSAGPYAFSPLGCDTPLFDLSEPSGEGEARGERLDARAVAQDIAEGGGRYIPSGASDDAPIVIERPVVDADGTVRRNRLPPERIVLVDSRARGVDRFTPAGLAVIAAATAPTAAVVALDVQRGRLAFLRNLPGADEPVALRALFARSGDIGGPSRSGGPAPDRRIGPGDDLAAALASGVGTVMIADSGAYASSSTRIDLVDAETLTIRAAGPDQSAAEAPWAVWSLDGGRGSLSVAGPPSARLVVEGLTLCGRVVLVPDADGAAPSLELRDATLVPGLAPDELGDPVEPGATSLDLDGVRTATVTLTRAVSGPILAEGAGVAANLEDSVVLDHRGEDSVVPSRRGNVALGREDAEGPTLSAIRSTIIGRCEVYALPLLSECLCTGTVTVRRRQEGCVRYSYLPPDSVTPRRHLCEPDRTLVGVTGLAAERLLARMRPRFRSLSLASPHFATLRRDAHPALLEGAENGAELGAFNAVRRPQRRRNLAARLGDDLPVGMEAVILWEEGGWT